MVLEWALDAFDDIKSHLCSDPYPRICWVRDPLESSPPALGLTSEVIADPRKSFLVWYYHVATSHATFAAVRRTITLTNLFAFTIFIFYPCMPPRLLPPEYGFLDSVGHNNAQSVWMKGKYVNSLAAMPSMHFGYSFLIGCTLIYHSGVFRSTLREGEVRKSRTWRAFYVALGIFYPALILLVIVAT